MSSLVNTICSMDNDEYKDSIIKDYKKYDLDEFSVMEIVKSMSISAIKNILDNHTLYSFTDRDLVKIVNFINDVSYKKKIISNYEYYNFDMEDVAYVVSSFDDDSKIEYIAGDSKFKFDSYCKSIIIDSISDDDSKYQIITNYKKYGLNASDVSFIISGFRDKNKYIYDFLANYEKFGFDSSYLAGIISLMNDSEKENILLDNKYGFNTLLMCEIITSFDDDIKREEVLNKLYDNGVFGNVKSTKRICLPPEMTIGVEIESEGKNSRFINTGILPFGWDIHIDTTLDKGTEVVSPILHKGDEEEINKVCSVLTSLGQTISGNCAGHIHIGAKYFDDDVECFKTLLELIVNTERILFLISNSAGDIPREKAIKYAIPITAKLVNKSINFEDVSDINSFSKSIHDVQDMYDKPRYSSVNFENLSIPLQYTVEFRTPNGTINADDWIDNINLFGGLMVASKKISLILKKNYDNMTDDDKAVLYYYEKIKDTNISDRDRLKLLLNLLPLEIDKNVYLDRYDVNSKLVKGHKTEEILDTISIFRPIRVNTHSAELRKKVVNDYMDCVKKNVNLR